MDKNLHGEFSDDFWEFWGIDTSFGKIQLRRYNFPEGEMNSDLLGFAEKRSYMGKSRRKLWPSPMIHLLYEYSKQFSPSKAKQWFIAIYK